MHWVIQTNIHRENGYEAFINAIKRRNLPHTFVKYIPIFHMMEPDINPENPVIGMGCYNMYQVTKEKNWKPGIFVNENFHYSKWKEHWGDHLLNPDAVVMKFGGPHAFFVDDVQSFDFNQGIFVRPCEDSKSFAGMKTTYTEFFKWRKKVLDLGDDCGCTIKKDMDILIAPLKEIYREYRFFVVDGKVITGSLYKAGTRVYSEECTERDVLWFAWRMAERWQPDRAFALDIAMTPDGFKIIEINSINSSGFYACDMSKVVEALEDLIKSDIYYGRF